MSEGLRYPRELKGGCLCGSVSYRVNGLLRGVVNCFCEQCRKTSGHYVAATRASWDAIELLGEAGLRWYESSPGVRRGFCQVCGASLFWDDGQDNQLSIMAGTLDTPTRLETVANIHTCDASDYCAVPDIRARPAE